MSTEKDHPTINAAIEAIGAARGSCPDVDELLAFAAGSLEASRRDEIQSHLESCPSCAMLAETATDSPPEVDEFTWKRSAQRLDQRAMPWRPRRAGRAPIAAALAAGVVLAIGFAWWRQPSPPIDPGVRGAGFTAVSPSGSLTRVSGFAWMAEPLADRYRLEVRAGESVVWEQTTTRQSITAPEALLRPGQPYRWRVEALDAGGEVISQTDWTEFRLTAIDDEP